jgi:hypothetical protein
MAAFGFSTDPRRSAKQAKRKAPTAQAPSEAPPSVSFNTGRASAAKHKPGIAHLRICHAPTSKIAQGSIARNSGLYAKKARLLVRPNSIDKRYAQRKGKRTVQANARTTVIRYPLFFIAPYSLNVRLWPDLGRSGQHSSLPFGKTHEVSRPTGIDHCRHSYP